MRTYEKVLGAWKPSQQLPGPGKPHLAPTPPPPVPAQDENYIVPISDEPTAQYVYEDALLLCPLAGPKPKKQGKPLPKVPPVPIKTKTEPKGLAGPKKVSSGSDITEELERKLQQRRANLEE